MRLAPIVLGNSGTPELTGADAEREHAATGTEELVAAFAAVSDNIDGIKAVIDSVSRAAPSDLSGLRRRLVAW